MGKRPSETPHTRITPELITCTDVKIVVAGIEVSRLQGGTDSQ
jgi:hypothetical protein